VPGDAIKIRETAMRDFLAENGLEMYHHALKKEGFSTMFSLQSLLKYPGNFVDCIPATVGMKQGEKMTLWGALTALDKLAASQVQPTMQQLDEMTARSPTPCGGTGARQPTTAKRKPSVAVAPAAKKARVARGTADAQIGWNTLWQL